MHDCIVVCDAGIRLLLILTYHVLQFVWRTSRCWFGSRHW